MFLNIVHVYIGSDVLFLLKAVGRDILYIEPMNKVYWVNNILLKI